MSEVQLHATVVCDRGMINKRTIKTFIDLNARHPLDTVRVEVSDWENVFYE